jgi:ribosomal protein S18 acetylase RimI-like enzyme
MALPGDRQAVEDIARKSFLYSRFHLDPAFSRAVADRIKAEWAGNFFHGQRGDHMVVAEVAGAVRGFLQLLQDEPERMTIDLIAVAEDVRGRGVASAMMGYAMRACRARTLRVGTQAANLASLRLYENLGFRVIATSYVLHRHGN